MTILLHSSKTMRSPRNISSTHRTSELIGKTNHLAAYIKTLSQQQLAKIMRISPTLAARTHQQFADWNTDPANQSLATDSFVGDIYSGLRAGSLSEEDRLYADKHLRILSGLYGILRPFDGVQPYRLEMGYKLPDPEYANLYTYWGDSIAKTLGTHELVINLASIEYSDTVTPYINPERLIAPKFLTMDAKTGKPTFVVVHAKIARGAFARWLITSRTDAPEHLKNFHDIGYVYTPSLSTSREPVFVCQEFGGKGLSMRLTANS